MTFFFCKWFGHSWDQWIARGTGGYEKRWCRRCHDWEMRAKMTEPTHRLDENHKGEPYIECLRCGRKSFNPNDIAQLYCGNCNGFHPLPVKK